MRDWGLGREGINYMQISTFGFIGLRVVIDASHLGQLFSLLLQELQPFLVFLLMQLLSKAICFQFLVNEVF